MDNKILRLKAQLGLLTLPFIISGQTHVEAWGRCFVSKWLTQFLDNEKKTIFFNSSKTNFLDQHINSLLYL